MIENAQTKHFEDSRVEVTTINSTWRKHHALAQSAVQTESISSEESSVQSDVSLFQKQHTTNTPVQTDAIAPSVPAAEKESEGSDIVIYPGDHFNDEDVLKFLQNIQKPVMDALEGNCRSLAFEGYEVKWTLDRGNISQLHTLSPKFALDSEWHVTQVAWNCNGMSIAASYGRLDVASWCLDKGHVCVWGSNTYSSKQALPDISIELDSYVTSLAYHPELPSLLAVGTHTGDVVCVSVGRDESNILMSTKGSTLTHRDPVCRLVWLHNKLETRESGKYILCSASGDGKVLMWTTQNKFEHPIVGYDVQSKKGGLGGILSMDVARTVMRLGGKGAVVPGLGDTIVFGLENGDVLISRPGCVISSVAPQQGKEMKNLSPLPCDTVAAHFGTVQCVVFTPFHRSIMATCGSDGCVKIYSATERVLLLSLEPASKAEDYLYQAAFSPFRPGVIASVSKNSFLYIFDLEVSRTRPSVSVQCGSDGCGCTSVAFHPSDPQILITGDMRGNVSLWQLPTELYSPTAQERVVMAATQPQQLRLAWGALLGVAL